MHKSTLIHRPATYALVYSFCSRIKNIHLVRAHTHTDRGDCVRRKCFKCGDGLRAIVRMYNVLTGSHALCECVRETRLALIAHRLCTVGMFVM
jgi:hypothetical protein